MRHGSWTFPIQARILTLNPDYSSGAVPLILSGMLLSQVRAVYFGILRHKNLIFPTTSPSYLTAQMPWYQPRDAYYARLDLSGRQKKFTGKSGESWRATAKLRRRDIVIATSSPRPVGNEQRYTSELLTDPRSKDRLNPLMGWRCAIYVPAGPWNARRIAAAANSSITHQHQHQHRLAPVHS